MQQLLGEDNTALDTSILKRLFLQRLRTEADMVLAPSGDSLDRRFGRHGRRNKGSGTT